MTNKNRMDASIECPYYVANQGKCITCSGGLEPGCKTETRFRTEARKREFMGHFCKRYYSLCPMVQTNDKKLGFNRPDARVKDQENE